MIIEGISTDLEETERQFPIKHSVEKVNEVI